MSVGLLGAGGVAAQPPAVASALIPERTVTVGLTALAQSAGATVLTLEGGLVGLQHLIHFTPMQLRGSLCDAPDSCEPVDYFAMPLGKLFNELAATRLIEELDAQPDDGGPITLYGHSQGGQVIYSALRRWAADPSGAPDPNRVSWVSIGNPENNFGGRAPEALPADSPYRGTEVIRQYDGWADWPTDPTNTLARINALVGLSLTHVFGYFNIDLEDPDNIRYTPDNADGSPGNITYVFVPTPTLPLIAMTGVLAPLLNPVLDPILRPLVEAGYQRPFGPLTEAGPAASQQPRARSVDLVRSVAPEVQVLRDGDADQDDEQHQRHDGRASDGRRPERLGVDAVSDKVGTPGRTAARQRVDRVENLCGADDSGDRDKKERRLQHR